MNRYKAIEQHKETEKRKAIEKHEPRIRALQEQQQELQRLYNHREYLKNELYKANRYGEYGRARRLTHKIVFIETKMEKIRKSMSILHNKLTGRSRRII